MTMFLIIFDYSQKKPGMAHLLKSPLKELLSAVMRGEVTQAQLNEITGLCQRMALVFVRKRISAGKINPEFLGLSDRDIALDCIAELFSPSPDGSYADFLDYFDDRSVNVGETPDRELLVHLRRLVFSVCSDGIFRMYGEADPSLSRIIRNIKLAVKRCKEIEVVSAFDEQGIVARSHPPDASLPAMPYEELQRIVDAGLLPYSGIPAVLDRAMKGVCEQATYRKLIPLTNFACCIREGYTRLNIRDPEGGGDPMFAGDIRTIVRDACDHVSKRAGSRYLNKGKIGAVVLEAYMAGIDALLTAEFLDQADGDIHYYDFFKTTVAGVSKEEYSEKHRAAFEYLTKLTRKRALQGLRDL